MEKSILVKHLEWDSNFFGFNVCIIHIDLITKELFSLIKQLSNDAYKLIYLTSNNAIHQNENFHLLGNIVHVDIKTTFSQEFEGNNQIYKKNENIRSYKLNILSKDLKDLALQSGAYSRFKIDQNFDPNRYEDLYTIWIENSIKRIIADEVLVYQEKEKILGFLTLKKYDKFGRIGLISVADDAKGKGIGKSLINSGFNYFLSNGLKVMYVDTQYANVDACRFYKKTGFAIINQVNFYHLWL